MYHCSDTNSSTMARCFLPSIFLVVVACGLVIISETEVSAQTLPTQYQNSVKAKDLAAARQAQQSWQQNAQSNSDLIQSERNDAQRKPPTNVQQINQQSYQPSYLGSSNHQYQQYSPSQQYSQMPNNQQPQEIQQQPMAAANPAQEPPMKQNQLTPATPQGNPPSPPPSTGFPCDDIKSTQCQESIDANITHGIAVLAQNLSVAITQTTAGYQEPENIVFSPVNVAAALAFVLVGSDGETFFELSRVLGIAAGLDLRPEVRDLMYEEFGRFLGQLERRQTVISSRQVIQGGNQVVFANGLFVQKNFCILERFEKIARYFRSEAHNIDFYGHPQQSKDVINAWFETNTLGRIKNMLVQAPPPDTRVLIASALYFNGEWETPFPSDVTAVRQFFVSMTVINNTYVDAYPVNMMTNSLDTKYYADKEIGCRMVELPYKGRNVSMYLILPDQPGVAALRELERRLTPEHLRNMISLAKTVPTIVSMPRMKLSQTVSLRSALEALGVYTLFDPLKANLTLISEGKAPSSNGECPKEGVSGGSRVGVSTPAPPTTSPTTKTPTWKYQANSASRGSHPPFDAKRMLLTSRVNSPHYGLDNAYIDRLYAADILHKVDVEVTETGTVAAAGTATTISRDGSNQVIRLNRPFLFLIRDNPTNLTMFYGSVVRPSPATQAEIDEAGPMATAVPPTRRPPHNSRASRG